MFLLLVCDGFSVFFWGCFIMYILLLLRFESKFFNKFI